MSHTFLDLVDLCNNCRVNHPPKNPTPFDSERLAPWYLTSAADSPIIGLLRPLVIEQLVKDNERSLSLGLRQTWMIHVDQPKPRVSFNDWFDTPEKRTEVMADLCIRWQDAFPDVCGPSKWRNELYPVYADPFGAHDESTAKPTNFTFNMERSCCAVFGVVTYGVHLTIFRQLQTKYHFWVPTRAKTKPTWPGLLDNTVAGGLESGSGVLQCLIKESMEEASIKEQIVRNHARAVGVISYFFRTPKGWLQPEVEYVYDMRIPEDGDSELFQPKPLDGEVEAFELLPEEEVTARLRAGRFKPNCALVLIDLFIRHGIITPDNEPDYLKIMTRLHGQFDYEQWG